MNHSYFIEHDIKILETTCERQDKRKGGVAFFWMDSRTPLPWVPPPHGPACLSMCVPKASCQVMWIPNTFLSDWAATPSPISPACSQSVWLLVTWFQPRKLIPDVKQTDSSHGQHCCTVCKGWDIHPKFWFPLISQLPGLLRSIRLRSKKMCVET